jgi:undecaprenyl-phosphate 4-deoxy-4-formamido-L-arabinose transferase
VDAVNRKADVVFSVVIPVFNEEGNLKPLYTRLTRIMRNLKKPYEIIFVDDGSSDRSFHILKDIYEKDKRVKIVRFTRNFGQHPAVMAGFNTASGEVIITLDADLQNPPEEIPKLIEKLDEGYEAVFGVFQERKHSAFRRAGSQFAKLVLSRVSPVETTDLSGFRALRSYAVDQLKLLNEKSKFLDGLLCWMGYKVGTVEVQHDERYSGKTKYTPFKLVSLWLDMVVSFTDLPLKIATFGGLFIGIVGFALALFYIVRYFLYGFGVPGFATIVILITFFSGVQLFALGILGEYVGRMNKEVKNKPEYIISEIISQPRR